MSIKKDSQKRNGIAWRLAFLLSLSREQIGAKSILSHEKKCQRLLWGVACCSYARPDLIFPSPINRLERKKEKRKKGNGKPSPTFSTFTTIKPCLIDYRTVRKWAIFHPRPSPSYHLPGSCCRLGSSAHFLHSYALRKKVFSFHPKQCMPEAAAAAAAAAAWSSQDLLASLGKLVWPRRNHGPSNLNGEIALFTFVNTRALPL